MDRHNGRQADLRRLLAPCQQTAQNRGRLNVAIHHSRSGEISCLVSIDDPATRTVALARTSSFEAIHLVMRAGGSIPSHHVAGTITLYCVAGQVRFSGGSLPELWTGDWLFLDPGTPHALEAVTDSSLLLTILFDGAGDEKAAPARSA